MAVSKRTRYEVLKRDNFTCRYCRSSEDELTIDHVVPVSLGGSDTPDNLVAACRDCNYGKASVAPDSAQVEDVKQDAVRWAAAMKVAIDEALLKQHQRDEYAGKVYEWWCKLGDEHYLDRDWESSVNRWWRDGVPLEFVLDAVFIAWGKPYLQKDNAMAYVAGIVKNKMADAHEKATELLAEEALDGA